MADISPDDVAWAAQAMADGRSMDYIASVLEVKAKTARAAIDHFRATKPHKPAAAPRQEQPQTRRHFFKVETPDMPDDRRRALLRRRFARHWDMIWFLRRCGMAGRTLRKIYGAEALIWSVGGGIDADIGEIHG